VATVRAKLPSPVIFGNWIMREREFAIVRIKLQNGISGWSFSLTRDGCVADQVRRFIAPLYAETDADDVQETFHVAQSRNHASHSAGIGLRALSLVDLAVWDARARAADMPITEFLGGSARPLPATAIIGYPPAQMGPDEIALQVMNLHQAGWRRFKAPMAATLELSAQRLRSARRAAPNAWIGCDAAWTFHDAVSAADFVNSLEDVRLGWFEDVFPPGNAEIVAELRKRTVTPIAMGDEQGGSYYPEALLSADAVDVIRVDVTCMGGISGVKPMLDQCQRAGVRIAPHMFAHVHSRVLSAWTHDDVPIEWGVPWTGVDPYADSLEQPQLDVDGRMLPLEQEPGFGSLTNLEWIAGQEFSDPDDILGF
jgi:L-alanine-DL-glutamate epimerase-like enolase superfamily enzyme